MREVPDPPNRAAALVGLAVGALLAFPSDARASSDIARGRDVLFSVHLGRRGAPPAPAAPEAAAPVLRALRRALDEALARSPRDGYLHLHGELRAIARRERRGLPEPLYRTLRLVPAFGTHVAEIHRIFPRYRSGREVMGRAVRHLLEHAQDALGAPDRSFRAMVDLMRHVLVGQTGFPRQWIRLVIQEEFGAHPEAVPNRYQHAGLMAVVAGPESARVEARLLHVLATEALTPRRYFEVAIEAGDRISDDYQAHRRMLAFLRWAPRLANPWARAAATGLVAAATGGQGEWAKRRFSSNERCRRRTRRIARFLAEHAEAPAPPGSHGSLFTLLDERASEGEYQLPARAVWSILRRIEPDTLPEELADALVDLLDFQFDDDDALRAWVHRVAPPSVPPRPRRGVGQRRL